MIGRHSYDTLSAAIRDLEARGYTHDFNLHPDGVELKGGDSIAADEFTIQEVYRFEGMSSTDDASVVYAIETTKGIKGLLIDAYGVYADSLSDEMLKKLRAAHH